MEQRNPKHLKPYIEELSALIIKFLKRNPRVTLLREQMFVEGGYKIDGFELSCYLTKVEGLLPVEPRTLVHGEQIADDTFNIRDQKFLKALKIKL